MDRGEIAIPSPRRPLCSPGSRTQPGQKVEPKVEKVIIPNTHCEKLVGLLHETGLTEMVILCHGFRSRKENKIIATLAVALSDQLGISAFRFDFFGNGESQGDFQYGNYSREADDLRSVIQHFRIIKNRAIIAILGHSKGGDMVLLYASKHNDIPTVINVSGRFNLKQSIDEDLLRIKQGEFIDVESKNKQRGKEGHYRVTFERLKDRLDTDMHEVCLMIGKEECWYRVLTVHGSADEVVPVGDALDFANFIADHKLHIIQGVGLEYKDDSYQSELASVVWSL